MQNRREFVRGVAAAAAGMWVAGGAGDLAAGALQNAATPRRRQITIGGRRVKTVDVHAHVTIPEATEMLRGTPLGRAGGAGAAAGGGPAGGGGAVAGQVMGPER